MDHSKGKNPYFDLGKAEIEKLGFKPVESSYLKERRWWSAGSAQQRVDDLHDMYKDSEIKAIFSQNGRHTSMDMLDILDYDLIANNPKPLFGFSDITNLLIAIYTMTGQVGFHSSLSTYNYGWVWSELENQKKNTELNMFLKVLCKDKPFGNLPLFKNWEIYKEGKATGSLFGGNLSMLNFLIGTKYFPKIESLRGNILFWEIDNVKTYRIYKTLPQLKFHGLLDVISGMIIGRNADITGSTFDNWDEPTQEDIVLEFTKKYNFPIISNVDFGHKGVNLVIPIGITAEMNTNNKTVSLIESAVL